MLCRIFFSLLISLQDFFSSKKGHVFTYTKCIYIYIVVIAVIVLIWSCKALKCCKLYKIIIVWLCFRKSILYTHFTLRQNKVMHHRQMWKRLVSLSINIIIILYIYLIWKYKNREKYRYMLLLFVYLWLTIGEVWICFFLYWIYIYIYRYLKKYISNVTVALRVTIIKLFHLLIGHSCSFQPCSLLLLIVILQHNF